MPLNTRAKKREPIEASAEYTINESTEKSITLKIPRDSIKSQLLDISVIGCAIDSPYIIPPGVILDIKIDTKPFVAETGGTREEPMKVTGRVTSCVMRSVGHYRLGVYLTNISKEDVVLIDNFIKAKERRKAPRWDMTQ